MDYQENARWTELKQARLQIAALQSETQVRQLEKAALENRLKKAEAAATTLPAGADAGGCVGSIKK